MPFPYVMRKKVVYALFLITYFNTSCCPQYNHWKLAVIKADCPTASYAKVYLPTCNPFNGLEAVLMSCNGNARLYFNALTLLFPCACEDEKLSEVSISIEEENYLFMAERLQGGQCLLMPDEAMLLITHALLKKKNVEVIVGRYQTILTYENFEKTYNCLVKTGFEG